MKIYAFALSAPSRYVMSVLKHAKIDFEPVDVDLTSQEQKSEAHLKRNPNGKVPVLEDGDFTLYESSAIVRYVLDTKAPGNTLYPQDPKTRAKLNQFLGGLNDLRNGQFIVTAGKVLLPRTGKSMPAKLLEVAEHAYKDALQKLNDKLFADNRKYLFGDHLTIADFLLAEMIMNAQMISINWEADYPQIHKYYTDLLTEVPELKEDADNVRETIEMLS